MWRMTQDGTTHDALNRMGDASGEQISFSPDRRFIVYCKTDYVAGPGENPKPSGIYIRNIATGVEQCLASLAGGRVPGHVAFSRGRNELLYPNVHTGRTSEAPSAAWVGAEAPELATHKLHSVPFGHRDAYLTQFERSLRSLRRLDKAEGPLHHLSERAT